MKNPRRSLLPLAGVIGWPVEHSLSPYVHGFWLNSYNIPGNYISLPVASKDLPDVLHTLPKCGFAGINITIPHKETAFVLADHASDTAQRLQAANTLYYTANGQIIADNTDGFGFIQNIIQHVPIDHDWRKPALIIGAGGASRAVVDAVLQKGASIVYLANRTKERAEKLANDLKNPSNLVVIDWEQKNDVIEKTELIVNTTSLGMKQAASSPVCVLDIDFNKAPTHCVVTDIVYTPLNTTFLQNATDAGLTTVDGLGMLLHQARPGFKRWFDLDTYPEVTPELRAYVLGEKF